ncbi:MAG TPA: hypothetical protein VGF55_06200 [Gemmataceae bacterium]|jgi:hypothetical protein
MDKQALKKHHFWILLALAVVLIPVAWFGAKFGVGGRAAEAADKIEKKQKELDSQKPKANDYRTKLDEQKAQLQAQKEIIWKAAYGGQVGLFRWPAALAHLNALMNPPDQSAPAKLYFGDPITDRDRSTFRSPEVYLAEYNKLPDIIAPAEFADRSWQKVLAPRYTDWSKTAVPSTEEAWLALEDLCVQREVLQDIHAVNEMLAEFLPDPLPPEEPAKPKGPAPEEQARYKDELGLYAKDLEKYKAAKAKVDDELKAAYKPQRGEAAGRFISPYWQLDLVVGRSPSGRAGELRFRGKLTNTSPRRQNVSRIDFKVWLRNSKTAPNDYAVLPIQYEYLAAGASVDFDETRIGPSDATLRINKIEQRLDTRYVPVKRVDQLVLGKTSHRFANKGLVSTAFSKEEMDKAAAAAPANPAGPGAAPDPAAMRGGGPNSTEYTPNGIPRMRYLERTDQVRRMPIGMVLIVDQGHIQDVLRALANSKLRFQTTQIHYERFRGAIALGGAPELYTPGAPDAAAEGGGPARSSDPTINRGNRMRGNRGGETGDESPGPARPPTRGPGGLRGGFGGGGGIIPPGGGGVIPEAPGGMSPGADDEASANLVELAVYGLISLYERFPPKPPAAPAGDTAAGQPQPATPAGPAAPAAPPPPAGAPIPPPPAPAGNPPPAPAAPPAG